MDRFKAVDSPDHNFVHGFIVREGEVVQVYTGTLATTQSTDQGHD